MTPSYAALFRGPYRALMAAALGATFLGSLDALMVTTALPSAAQDIGGVDLIAVTVGATLVTVTMTLPVAGSVIDRYGAGRSFLIAVVLFTIANVIGGLAPSMPVVAFSRAVLGLGAGFMFAVPLGLFALYVPDALRPRAFGVNAAMWGVSAVIGPALGAALTGTLGWRWVFWINLPAIAAVAAAARVALRRHAGERPAARPRGRLNVVGPVLLGLVVAALLALPPLALVPALAFLLSERRASEPVFTHRRTSLAVAVVAAATGSAFLGAETYLPLQIQVGYGHGVALVGGALVAATLGWTTGSMGAARFHAAPRTQITVGAALVFAGTLAMALPLAGAVSPIVGYTVSGLGMGISSPALFAAVLVDRDEGREGQTTSAVPLARQVGAGVGTAIAGAVFAGGISARAVHAAEHTGAHVPVVVGAVRGAYVATALLGLVGLAACRFIERRDLVAATAGQSAERAAEAA